MSKRPVVAKRPTPGEGDRQFAELRARYEASMTADPAVLTQPPSIHLQEALYALGKCSEASLADSRAQIRKWGQELAVHALHLVRSAELEDEE